jgi:hypothetical protein
MMLVCELERKIWIIFKGLTFLGYNGLTTKKQIFERLLFSNFVTVRFTKFRFILEQTFFYFTKLQKIWNSCRVPLIPIQTLCFIFSLVRYSTWIWMSLNYFYGGVPFSSKKFDRKGFERKRFDQLIQSTLGLYIQKKTFLLVMEFEQLFNFKSYSP